MEVGESLLWSITKGPNGTCQALWHNEHSVLRLESVRPPLRTITLAILATLFFVFHIIYAAFLTAVLVFFEAPHLYGADAPGAGIALILICDLPLLVCLYLMLADTTLMLVDSFLQVEVLELDAQGYVYSSELKPAWLQRFRGLGIVGRRGPTIGSEGDLAEIIEHLAAADNAASMMDGARTPPASNNGAAASGNALRSSNPSVAPSALGPAGEGQRERPGDERVRVRLGEGLAFGDNLTERDALFAHDAIRKHLTTVGAWGRPLPRGPGRPPRYPYHETLIRNDGSVEVTCCHGLHNKVNMVVGYMCLWTLPLLAIVPFVPKIEGYKEAPLIPNDGSDYANAPDIAPFWAVERALLGLAVAYLYLNIITITADKAKITVTRSMQVLPVFRLPLFIFDGLFPALRFERLSSEVEHVGLRVPFASKDCDDSRYRRTQQSRAAGQPVVDDGSAPEPPSADAQVRVQFRAGRGWWRSRRLFVPPAPVRERDWLRWHMAAALGVPLDDGGRGAQDDDATMEMTAVHVEREQGAGQ